MASAGSSESKTKIANKSYSLYLGVDGGGTKTHVVLIDNDKNVVGEGLAGASNPLRTGIETAVTNILKAVEAAQNGSIDRGEIVSAMLGLAGVRRADVRQRIRERITRRLGIQSVEIVTDAEIALYGTTLGKAGIVIIAGTGSVCYGKNEQGETAISGGWGPLAGDEGGGISIARRGLQAIAKASDGRGKLTKLSWAGTAYFRTSKPENLLTAIYAPQMDNAKIAGFARFVVETAQAGDAAAIEILREAGLELGIAADAVLKKLKLTRRKIPIGCVGSIFRAEHLITDALSEIVHQSAPKAFITAPILQPGNAAAELAFLMSKRREK